MDWALAIRRNREALERILAALFALAGLDGGSHPEARAEAEHRRTLPRHLHGYALRILRAAESAIRRLVVIAAREVVVQPRPAGEVLRPDFCRKLDDGVNAPVRILAFPLFDPLRKYPLKPRRRASKSFPRICVVGFTEPTPIPEKPVLSPDDPVDAARLCRRLLSSRRALANLPREARRLARRQARTRLKLSQGRPGRVSPLRIGRPPGGRTCTPKPTARRRKHTIHAVDDILKECHALALDVLSPPDTS